VIVDETVLLAYVDGELDPAARQQVDTALAHSAALREQLQALRASCLPYQAAFDAQGLPPTSARLEQRVQTMLSVMAAATPPGATAVAPPGAAPRRRIVLTASAMAASFAAGLLVPRRLTSDTFRTAALRDEPWVGPIASYHAMYVRETVGQQADSPARLGSLLAGFDSRRSSALFVPDLSPAGLKFMRVQRLGYEGRPVIQMVYLPVQGRPVALCALAVEQSDAPPGAARLHGQSVASWKAGGLAQVLVSEPGELDSLTVARALLARNYRRLSA
jgi:anti-sigma factor RsiW